MRVARCLRNKGVQAIRSERRNTTMPDTARASRARKGKGKASRKCALETMPAELCFHTASFLTPSGLLRLALATGRGGALRSALAECRDLQRAARVRRESDEAVFARWIRLPEPLLGAVATLATEMLAQVYTGAALSGVAALSRLDVLARRHAGAATRAVDMLLRKNAREAKRMLPTMRSTLASQLPDGPGAQHALAPQLDTVLSQTNDAILGNFTSVDGLFRSTLSTLTTPALVACVGPESAEAAWLGRHGTLSLAVPTDGLGLTPPADHPVGAPAHGEVEILTSQRMRISDLVVQMKTTLLATDAAPRVGDVDVASALSRVLTRALAPCAAPTCACKTDDDALNCDECLESDICAHCARRATFACGSCHYALCAACAAEPPDDGGGGDERAAEGAVGAETSATAAVTPGAPAAAARPRRAGAPPTHQCDPRQMHMAPLDADAHAAASAGSQFASPVDLFTACSHAIARAPYIPADGPQLEANRALWRRVQLQRRWFRTVDSDRLEAARALARGERAHLAWLEAKYGDDPLA